MDGLLLFVLMLAPLVFLQRLLHREIQAVLLILTRNLPLTMGLFSILFLPGVFLHEFSHFIMAKMLGVSTGGFSITPRHMPDGRLQLGYVETVQSDIVRDSLIGLAPLITGGLFVAYAGIQHLNLLLLWAAFRTAQFEAIWQGISSFLQVKDLPLWFYLTFTVSSTMMPSASDRHAFLPLALYAAVLGGLAFLVGAGPWLFETLAAFLSGFLRSVATMFGLSVMVHIILVPPAMLIHTLLASATGMDIK
jgi:hypothetical protein